MKYPLDISTNIVIDSIPKIIHDKLAHTNQDKIVDYYQKEDVCKDAQN